MLNSLKANKANQATMPMNYDYDANDVAAFRMYHFT